jgi:hypothetical protein
MSQWRISGARCARRVCACALLLALGACETFNPQPWERDLMAKKAMQLGNNAVVLGIDDHIYFSKEGASGGRSTAGGGCGCN